MSAAALAFGASKETKDEEEEKVIQIAIGVKKEVDFVAWYTNVSSCLSAGEPYNGRTCRCC